MKAGNGEVRIVHAGDLSTKEAFALDWRVGILSHRLQEIAIADGTVVASWRYEVTQHRRRWRLESEYTEVAKRWQRQGLAVRLWHHGVAIWKPTRIDSVVGTPEGQHFLARMKAELALSSPDLFLSVKVETENFNTWTRQQSEAALAKLRELGLAAATSSRPKHPPAAKLKAVS